MRIQDIAEDIAEIDAREESEPVVPEEMKHVL